MLLHLSVPSEGELRIVAADIAARIAEYVGVSGPGDPVTAAVEKAAAQVAGSNGEIAFVFRLVDGELHIEARCGARASEVRCPLPA